MNKTELKEKLTSFENRCFSNDIYLFLKINKPFNDSKLSRLFWESDFIVKFAEDLSQTDIWELIISAYFSNNLNANSTFLNTIIRTDSFNLINTYIKINKSYLYPNHWDSFNLFKDLREVKYKAFFQELLYLKKNQEYWANDDKEYLERIVKYSYEDILIQTISFFQKFKNYSPRNVNNNQEIISYRITLLHILKKLINAKKDSKKTNEIKEEYTTEDFSIQLNKELPPLRPKEYFLNNFEPSYLPTENIGRKKKEIRDIINFQFAKASNDYNISKYLAGFANFEMIDGYDANIITNSRYTNYRNSTKKDKYNEHYLINKAIEVNLDKLQGKSKTENDISKKKFLIQKHTSIEFFKFYKIPLVFEIDSIENKIDFEKVIYLLQLFSSLLFPQGRYFILDEKAGTTKNNDSVFSRQIDDGFKKVFSSKSNIDYITVFEEKELIDKCIQFFEWGRKEVENIIHYLTLDLKNNEVDFAEDRPFIKLGNKYFWLSALNKDFKWEVLLHRRFANDKTLAHNKQSEDAEQYIADLFTDAGFKSKPSHKYHYNSDEGGIIRGDIDTLAYKDKTLFIVELKNTYTEENILKETKYYLDKFKVVASNQLEKAVGFISNSFKEVASELNIDCAHNDLTIITLVVSNVFIGDDYIINDKHLKLSLFELTILLKNDLYKMRTTQMMKVILNKENLEGINVDRFGFDNPSGMLKPGQEPRLDMAKCNLWKDKEECTPNDIVTAIKENKIWNHIKNESISAEEITLGRYNPEYRYID